MSRAGRLPEQRYRRRRPAGSDPRPAAASGAASPAAGPCPAAAARAAALLPSQTSAGGRAAERERRRLRSAGTLSPRRLVPPRPSHRSASSAPAPAQRPLPSSAAAERLTPEGAAGARAAPEKWRPPPPLRKETIFLDASRGSPEPRPRHPDRPRRPLATLLSAGAGAARRGCGGVGPGGAAPGNLASLWMLRCVPSPLWRQARPGAH